VHLYVLPRWDSVPFHRMRYALILCCVTAYACLHLLQVSRGMLTLSESVKFGLMAAAMAAAAAARSALPHQILAGCALLAAVAIATWLWSPGALTQAYQHMSLSYNRQWTLLTHLRWVAVLQ
jgi:hypothetical protein